MTGRAGRRQRLRDRKNPRATRASPGCSASSSGSGGRHSRCGGRHRTGDVPVEKPSSHPLADTRDYCSFSLSSRRSTKNESSTPPRGSSTTSSVLDTEPDWKRRAEAETRRATVAYASASSAKVKARPERRVRHIPGSRADKHDGAYRATNTRRAER